MNKRVSVYVAALTYAEQERWVENFAKFFVGATSVRGVGYWRGEGESVVVVSHLYDTDSPDFKVAELLELAELYKADCKQEAVLITYEYVDIVQFI
jgi:hypothetical protein